MKRHTYAANRPRLHELEAVGGNDTHERLAAKYASDAHLERILGVFQRFELEHGLLPGEGAVLLLDTGVRL